MLVARLMYANDQANRIKCKSKPWSCCPFGICPPWASPKSVIGQGCRGIPKTQSGAGIDFLYGVSTAMKTVSLVDTLMVVPQQTKAIATQEYTVAEQARVDKQSIIDQAHAAEMRERLIKYAQWGGVALAGVLVASVVVRAVRPSRSTSPQVRA